MGKAHSSTDLMSLGRSRTGVDPLDVAIPLSSGRAVFSFWVAETNAPQCRFRIRREPGRTLRQATHLLDSAAGAAHQNESLLTSRSREGGGLKSSLSLLSVNLGSGLQGTPSKRERKTSRTRPRLPRTSKKIPLVRLRRTSAWTSPGIKFSACQHQLGVRCRPKKP